MIEPTDILIGELDSTCGINEAITNTSILARDAEDLTLTILQHHLAHLCTLQIELLKASVNE